jgi:Nucleotide modification associated domain 1
LSNTSTEYDAVIDTCKRLFIKKTIDYGTAWRILRPESITDQIFIKAQRIRTLEEKKISKVDEDITGEYIGIVNYCVIAMMQLDSGPETPVEIPADKVGQMFDAKVKETKDLMFAKNHDYGEAWRDMRISSLTDLILMKILRVKQIEDNKGQTLASEGIKANYQDMLNYAVFALIKLSPLAP